MTPEEVANVLSAFGQATGPAVLTGVLFLIWRGELVTKGHLEDVKALYREREQRLLKNLPPYVGD